MKILLTRLSKGRSSLERRYGDLDRLRRTPIRPKIEKKIKEIIERINPNLKDVHFENARPTRWEINPTIKAVENTRSGADGKPDWTDPKVRRRLVTIFGRTYVDKALKALRDTAEALNSEDMKKFNKVEIQGHTSALGNDTNNMTLSDRRARLVKAILVREGVQSSRLTARGYGEEQLKNKTEKDPSADRQDRAAAADENRRIEIHVDDGELKRVIGEAHAEEEKANPPPPPAPAPAPAPKPAPKSPKKKKKKPKGASDI